MVLWYGFPIPLKVMERSLYHNVPGILLLMATLGFDFFNLSEHILWKKFFSSLFYGYAAYLSRIYSLDDFWRS